jgi:hypothetical protein
MWGYRGEIDGTGIRACICICICRVCNSESRRSERYGSCMDVGIYLEGNELQIYLVLCLYLPVFVL